MIFKKYTLYQAYILIFFTEFMLYVMNPSYVELFFDEKSPFSFTVSHSYTPFILYGYFLLGGQISGCIANIFWGFISDYIGKKPVLIISNLSIIIIAYSAILAEYYKCIYLLILGSIFGHLLYGIFPVIMATITNFSYKMGDNKLLLIGRLQFFIGLALVTGPTLGSVLIKDTFNYIYPYYLIGIMAIILFILVIMFYTINHDYTSHKYQSKITNNIYYLVLCLKNKKILLLVWLLLLNQLAWGNYFQFIQPLAKLKFNFTINEIGYLLSFIGLSLMISALMLQILKSWIYNKTKLFFIGIMAMILGSIGSILIMLSSINKILFYLVNFIMTFGDMIVFSILVVGFSNTGSYHNQGFISGFLYTLSKGIGWGLSGILGGYLIYINMVYSMLFSLFILLLLLISFIVFKKKLKKCL